MHKRCARIKLHAKQPPPILPHRDVSAEHEVFIASVENPIQDVPWWSQFLGMHRSTMIIKLLSGCHCNGGKKKHAVSSVHNYKY